MSKDSRITDAYVEVKNPIKKVEFGGITVAPVITVELHVLQDPYSGEVRLLPATNDKDVNLEYSFDIHPRDSETGEEAIERINNFLESISK